MLDLPIEPHSTQLRALPRQAVNAIVEIKDRHRYLRALTPYIGYETRTVEYRPISRSGKPGRESVFDAADTALAVIVGNSTRPLRMVDLTGEGLARIGAHETLCSGPYDAVRPWSRAL